MYYDSEMPTRNAAPQVIHFRKRDVSFKLMASLRSWPQR